MTNPRFPVGRAALTAVALSASLAAQTAWTKLTPAAAPSPRTQHAMVWDGSSILLFGGQAPGNGGYLNDTWRFDGVNWTQLTPTTSPPPRGGHAMAYDPKRDRVVLFSGWNGGGYPQDTWEFDGQTWARNTSATQPPERDWAAMGYDPVTEKLILVGGHDFRRHANNGPGAWDDMWSFDGTWTQLTPTGMVPKRFGHAMVQTPVLVVTGGVTPGAAYDDMWRWDGTNWTQLTPPALPGQRNWPAFAYDEGRRRHILTAGRTGSTSLTDTVENDGTTWIQRAATGGLATSWGAAAYDPVRAITVAFGGTPTGSRGVATNDTWVYGAVRPGTVTPFGSGCAGTAGTPAVRGTPPYIASTFRLEMTNIGASGRGVFHIGASRTMWNGNPLPFDLGGLGAPGCRLLVGVDVLLGGTRSGSLWTLAVTLPNDPSLIGQSVFAQGWGTDPGGNTAQLVFGNGVDIRVGSK